MRSALNLRKAFVSRKKQIIYISLGKAHIDHKLVFKRADMSVPFVNPFYRFTDSKSGENDPKLSYPISFIGLRSIYKLNTAK